MKFKETTKTENVQGISAKSLLMYKMARHTLAFSYVKDALGLSKAVAYVYITQSLADSLSLRYAATAVRRQLHG